jgi:hypothetical protein
MAPLWKPEALWRHCRRHRLQWPFNRSFNRIPIVLTTVSSDDEVGPVTTHVQAVTKSELRVDLYGGGSATEASTNTRLSYVAWEPSVGTLQGIAFEAQRAPGVRAKRMALPGIPRRVRCPPGGTSPRFKGVAQTIH